MKEHVRNFLDSIPSLKIHRSDRLGTSVFLRSFDMSVIFEHKGVDYIVVITYAEQNSPRMLRPQIYRIRLLLHSLNEPQIPDLVVVPMVFSQYFSPLCRDMCSEHKIAFLDLCGNAEFVTETLYVSREVERKPTSEARKLRSIFGPKAGAILRAMLLEPNKAWKVKDLAHASDTSLGHVSNIRSALIDHEWIEKRKSGVSLIRPDLLLQTWRENYRKPRGEFLHGYTYLREGELEQILNDLFEDLMQEECPPLVYARNSASQYFAPFLRGTSRFFYANDLGVRLLEDELDLSYVDRGENIVIQVVNDRGILRDSVEVVPRILCTDPITTYLDLWNGNDREREAAEILAQEYFPWLN